MKQTLILFIVSLIITTSYSSEAQEIKKTALTYTYKVVHEYPHDPRAFTQGLVISEGILYEGTGKRGRSSLRRVDLKTGEVELKFDLPIEMFGEGITVFNHSIFQLTWTSRVGLVYNKESFAPERDFTYQHDGWGITNTDTELIVSDGTEKIRFYDPDSFKLNRTITVHDGSQTIEELNELEYIQGEIYANVWETDWIVRIDPTTGKVKGWIDLTGLLSQTDKINSNADVLNGIAYNKDTNQIYVTGKLWPKLFEIEILPKPSNSPRWDQY
jgi:glutamine cyclotransferase